MERQNATLDGLIAALRDLTGYSEQHLSRVSGLLSLGGTAGQQETARQRSRRLDIWRRMLQDIPLDERSFDGRFGLNSRADTIGLLRTWCLGHPARSAPQPAGSAELFGFVSLFLLTLLSLAESEARRSLPQVADYPAHSSEALTHDCDGVCGVLVEQTAVTAAVYDVYSPRPADHAHNRAAVREWRAVERDSLRFHRHGSTSIILRGTASTAVHGTLPQFALKLILYPFTRIGTITQATRAYAETYDTASTGSRHLVHVWASFDNWILMDFIRGKTLAETIHDDAAREPENSGDVRVLRLDRLRTRGLLLFEALEELQRIAGDDPLHRGVRGVHADLTPSNIIISDADGSFKLIDLGRNYLHTHAVTGTTGVESSFIAPEVRAGDAEIARADLYSLGHLLILFGCGRASRDGVVPDIFYMRALLLARLLEDLIDASPARRLLIFAQDPGQAPGQGQEFSFTALKNAFLAELEMVTAAERNETELRVESGWSALRELLRPLAGGPGREWRLWRMRRQQGVQQSVNRMLYTNWLFAWSILAAAAWAITNTTVVTWLLRDMDLDWGNKVVELIQHLSHNPEGLPVIDTWRNSDYHLPDLRANLPARLVGLSYALAAPKYYEMLFSGLTPLVIGRRAGSASWIALAAEAVMRLMALAPCTLVMTAMLIEPRWWPINSAIGQWLTWLANFVTLAYIRSVTARSRQLRLSTVPTDDSKITGYLSFSQWVPTSLFYATAVVTVGSFLYVDLLHDEWVYALAVTSTNIFLFYVIKCGIGGPTIRVTMARTCLAAERVGRCA
ncbi:hypothetical protein [Streptomyces sp. NPDC050560]|uniref:hypothetical protein n=1 Tax=Streptomyces sp. NPDC050560 TaxID=3365630 RepID=UPI0037B711E0